MLLLSISIHLWVPLIPLLYIPLNPCCSQKCFAPLYFCTHCSFYLYGMSCSSLSDCLLMGSYLRIFLSFSKLGWAFFFPNSILRKWETKTVKGERLFGIYVTTIPPFSKKLPLTLRGVSLLLSDQSWFRPGRTLVAEANQSNSLSLECESGTLVDNGVAVSYSPCNVPAVTFGFLAGRSRDILSVRRNSNEAEAETKTHVAQNGRHPDKWLSNPQFQSLLRFCLFLPWDFMSYSYCL